MEIKQITFSHDFFEQICLEDDLQEICSKWTLQKFLGASYKKDITLKDGYIFRLVGNKLQRSDEYECFELALFVKIDCRWVLVSGSSMVFSSNGRINEVARDVLEHISDNKVAFETGDVVNLFEAPTFATQVG